MDKTKGHPASGALLSVSCKLLFLPVFRPVALDVGAGVAVVTADSGTAAADGVGRILFKGRGLQVDEMVGRKLGSTMAVPAVYRRPVGMQTMPA